MLVAVGVLLVTGPGTTSTVAAADLGQRLRPGGVTWSTRRSHQRLPRPGPAAGAAGRRRVRPLELARWAWRQLTSMRTALVLLFLLALAAVPGSLVPQRGVDAGPGRAVHGRSTRASRRATTGSGCSTSTPSPWFAAIYLLLFVSLVGCVVPRSRAHLRGDARPAAARAAQPGPAARRTRRSTSDADAGRGAGRRRGGAAGAARFRVDRRRRTRCRRREGLPARDRQPVFHLSLLRPAASRWPSGTCSATRAASSSSRARRSPTPSSAYDTSRRRALRRRVACAPFTRRPRRADGALPAERATSAAHRATSRPIGPLHDVARTPSRRSYDAAGQPPAGRRRHEGLPDRPRLRAGLHGARRHRRGRVRRRRCRSCRGTANITSIGVVKVAGAHAAAARLRGPLPAHRGDRPAASARSRSTPTCWLPRRGAHRLRRRPRPRRRACRSRSTGSTPTR